MKIKIPRAKSTGEEYMALQLKSCKLPAPEREYRFNPGRDWRFDFAWPKGARKIALEVEGGTWSGGRHTRGGGYESDCIKYSTAAVEGWCVIRATTGMVKDLRALALVERALTP